MNEGWDGHCNVMWRGDDLEVLEADPRVVIAAELAERLRLGYGHPAVTLDGDVLTIRGVNRTVIYRIGDYDPAHHGYRAEWPD